MIMKKIHIILCLVVIAIAGNAQSLSSFVISTTGGYYSNASGQLSFTAGEMGLVNTFNQTNSMLTQGFQQPELNPVTTFLNNQKSETFSWTIFPNPGNGQYQLTIKIPETVIIDISIYNLFGELISENKFFDLKQGFQTIPFSITEANDGIYLAHFSVYSISTQSSKTFNQYIELVK